MKKILVYCSFFALIAALYTFQSCTKESTENTENTESLTTDLLIQDKDFQDFSVLHNNFTGQWKFLQAGCTGQQRQEYLDLIKLTSNNPTGTLDNMTEVLSILGFDDLNQANEFITKYKRLYTTIKKKPVFSETDSEGAIRIAIFKAFTEYSKNLIWKVKQNQQGSIQVTENNNTVDLNHLNSEQKSGNGEINSCEYTYTLNVTTADMNLNDKLLQLENDWGRITNAVCAYSSHISNAADVRCMCINEHN
jgi:hypothetical protein